MLVFTRHWFATDIEKTLEFDLNKQDEERFRQFYSAIKTVEEKADQDGTIEFKQCKSFVNDFMEI